MLDMKFVRENPDAVKENIKKKFQDQKLPLVDEVIALDAENRAVITEASELRAQRNKLSKSIGALMGQGKKEEAEEVKKQVTAQAQRLKELEAREEELEGGYLALEGGCRAGVCGRWTDGRVRGITSICIRLARAVTGCADGCMSYLYAQGRPVSALTLSPPGLGKTTLLRDMARQLSNGTRWGAGVNVAVADERRELGGSGTLDLGARTDILEGCGKAEALSMLVRTMRPDVIVTDELGREGDALAVREAIRCGAAVIASAHADSLGAAFGRRVLKALLEERLFERIILLAGGVGRIQAIYDGGGEPLFEAKEI